MKRLLSTIAVLAAILIVSACDKELKGGEDDRISISAELINGMSSKVSFENDILNKAINIEWEVGDNIYLFWKEGDDWKSGTYTIASDGIDGEDAKKAKFTYSSGNELSTATGKDFYAFYIPDQTIDSISTESGLPQISYDLSNQDGILTSVSNTAYMCAFYHATGEKVSLKFKNQFAIFGFVGISGLAQDSTYRMELTTVGSTMKNKGVIKFDSEKGEFVSESSDTAEDNVSLTLTGDRENIFLAVPVGEGLPYVRMVVSKITNPGSSQTEKAVYLASTSITDGSKKITAGTCYMKNVKIFITNEYALPGEFEVGAGKKIRFSPGNLQYQASQDGKVNNGIWRFAEHQWDIVADGIEGSGTVQNSNNKNYGIKYTGWIDLFCYGTSGSEYTPYSENHYASQYPVFENLTFDNQLDWGINKISNADNSEKQWYTMSQGEWVYLFKNYKWAFVSVAETINNNEKNISGIMIFPDKCTSSLEWKWPSIIKNENEKINDFNQIKATTPTTTISDQTFTQFQKLGVIFLPIAGYRYGAQYNKDIRSATGKGYGYWTSSGDIPKAYYCPYAVQFKTSGSNSNYFQSFSTNQHKDESVYVEKTGYSDGGYSLSVRLVTDASKILLDDITSNESILTLEHNSEDVL